MSYHVWDDDPYMDIQKHLQISGRSSHGHHDPLGIYKNMTTTWTKCSINSQIILNRQVQCHKLHFRPPVMSIVVIFPFMVKLPLMVTTEKEMKQMNISILSHFSSLRCHKKFKTFPVDEYDLHWDRTPPLLIWTINYIHCKVKTSRPLKFGDGTVIASHKSHGMWLLIHAGIEVNPC